MHDYQISSLTIHGHQKRALPNRFFRLQGDASMLGIIFPGLNYSADMPLCYYPAALLRQHGADVMQLQVDYTVSAYQSLSPEGRFNWLSDDAMAVLTVALGQRRYTHLALVGKSIGTLALCALTRAEIPAKTAFIWLTPLLQHPLLLEAARSCPFPSLFIAGSADSLYSPEGLERIQRNADAESLIIEGANHSLEISADFFRSLQAMQDAMQTISSFLERRLFA